MIIFLYCISAIWTVLGLLLITGAWKETEAAYEQITGRVFRPVELKREEHDIHQEQKVVMAKIFLYGDHKEYRIRGKLYHLNRAGMESIQVDDTLRLMVKKTSFLGGFKLNGSAKSAPVSGIYRSNGDVIIPLEKGIAQSRQRLLIGFGFIALGLLIGIWTYLKTRF